MMPLLTNGMMPAPRMGLPSGLGSGLLGPRIGLKGLSGIKWGSVLVNTQRTLNLVNQAIPIYRQAKPMIANMKTARKIIRVLNDEPKVPVKNQNNYFVIQEQTDNKPKFFI